MSRAAISDGSTLTLMPTIHTHEQFSGDQPPTSSVSGRLVFPTGSFSKYYFSAHFGRSIYVDVYTPKTKRRMPPRSKIRPGDVFGRLTVLTMPDRAKVECLCSCGTWKEIGTSRLVRGEVISCGCAKTQRLVQGNIARIKHGHSRQVTKGRTPTYNTWVSLNIRCRHPNDRSWRWYGGRPDSEGGPVTVCEHIRFGTPDAFQHFLTLMGLRPEGMCIDRIDSLDGYHCGSCSECKANGWVMNMRWATQFTNIHNRTRYAK